MIPNAVCIRTAINNIGSNVYSTTSFTAQVRDLVNVDRNLQLSRHLSDNTNVKYHFDRKQYKMAARLKTIDLQKSTLWFPPCAANTNFHALTLGGRTNHSQTAKIASE